MGAYAQGNIAFNVGDHTLNVLENRRRLQQNLSLTAWSELNQVHGDVMHLDPEPTPLNNPLLPAADGLATTQPGLALVIKTADCQPVLLASLDGKHIAALHVGWKGNRIGFIDRAVKEFCAHYRLSPRDLVAVRGPSLSPANSQFTNFDAEWGPEFLPWFNQENRSMDLWRLTHHQLMEAGLESRNIFGLDFCTFERADLFFSHRRDRGTSGRQASLIWIA